MMYEYVVLIDDDVEMCLLRLVKVMNSAYEIGPNN